MRIRRDKEHEIEGLTDEEIEVIVKASDALAHPVRIKLYRFIMKNNIDRIRLCNKDIVAAMDYSQATISQHLTKLCKAGLLDTVKEDKFTYCYANMGVLMKYLNATKKLFTFKFGDKRKPKSFDLIKKDRLPKTCGKYKKNIRKNA